MRHVASGREIPIGRTPPGEPSARSFAFASGGSRAAWVREPPGSGRGGSFELASVDLDRPDAVPARIRAALDDLPEMAVSGDGRRVAFLLARVLEVVDAANGETIAAREIVDWRVHRALYFAADGRLRLYPRTRLEPKEGLHELLELDPTTGELSATGSIAVDSPGAIFRPGATGERALFLDRGRSRIALLDARSGRETGVLPSAGELRGAAFLAGGRIAAAYRTGTGGTGVRIFTHEAAEEATMDLPSPPAAVVILGEPAPGRLVLASNPAGANAAASWTVALLDVPARRISATWPGYAPLDALAFWAEPALSGAPAILLRSPAGGLARFDPKSGTVRTVSKPDAVR